MDWGEKWLVDFNSGKTQFVSCNWSINSFSISFKMDGSALERKSFLKMFQDCLFFMNWIGGLSLPLLYPRKLEPCSFPKNFFLLRLLSFSINLPYGLAWTTFVMSRLGIPVGNRFIGLLVFLLLCSLEALAHPRNVSASLSPFWRYYFGRYSFELAE